MNVEHWSTLAQILVGLTTGVLVPVVGWVSFRLQNHGERLSIIETRVATEQEDILRRFRTLEKWMEKLNEKMDKVLEKP